MKKSILKIAVFIFLGLSAFTSMNAQVKFANDRSTSTLDPTLEYRASIIGLALESGGYKIADYGLKTIREGEKKEMVTTGYKGYEYTVFVLGAEGLKDIDLYVYDSSGQLITYTLENNDVGVTALTYKMNRTDDIIIQAKNYDSQSPYKAYQVAFVVAYKHRF